LNYRATDVQRVGVPRLRLAVRVRRSMDEILPQRQVKLGGVARRPRGWAVSARLCADASVWTLPAGHAFEVTR